MRFQCGFGVGTVMTVPFGVGLVFTVALGFGAGVAFPATLGFGTGVVRFAGDDVDGAVVDAVLPFGFAAGTSVVIFPFSQIWPMFPLLISNSITLRLGFKGSAGNAIVLPFIVSCTNWARERE